MSVEPNKPLKLIQSPLNYTGGKFKLLPQILPLFPKKIGVFVDLFCGGANVGVNVPGDRIVLNDTNSNLIQLFSVLKSSEDDFSQRVNNIIRRYGLSQSDRHGYDFYNCDGSNGLASYNKDKFLRLRDNFNSRKKVDEYYYAMLYTLIVYSFNNQIRFNSHGQFNLPVGKRDFNKSMQQKLGNFISKLKGGNFEFSNLDFREFDISKLDSSSLVYADPPYLITCATYNEQGGWDEEDEKELLKFLDRLHKNKVRFALSNVLRSKGKENSILIDWVKRNHSKYSVKNLVYDYNNSNYQIKNKKGTTEEVLVINY